MWGGGEGVVIDKGGVGQRTLADAWLLERVGEKVCAWCIWFRGRRTGAGKCWLDGVSRKDCYGSDTCDRWAVAIRGVK